jgi:hypothetical protein
MAATPRVALLDGVADPDIVILVGDTFGNGDAKLPVEVVAGFVATKLVGNDVLNSIDSSTGHR